MQDRSGNARAVPASAPAQTGRVRVASAAFCMLVVLGACAPATPDASAPPVATAEQSPAAAAPADTAAPAAAAVAPAAVPDAASAAAPDAVTLPVHFSVDDPRLGTQVGVRTPGMGLSTSGRAGFLVFGGYTPLPAGRYEAVLQGSAQPGHAGTLYADVAAGKGTEVITSLEVAPAALDAAALSGALAVVPFDLASPRTDIEVRLRVTPESKVTVAGFEIRARP
jgi:hypothetical protein